MPGGRTASATSLRSECNPASKLSLAPSLGLARPARARPARRKHRHPFVTTRSLERLRRERDVTPRVCSTIFVPTGSRRPTSTAPVSNRRRSETEAVADPPDVHPRIDLEAEARRHMALQRALPGDQPDRLRRSVRTPACRRCRHGCRGCRGARTQSRCQPRSCPSRRPHTVRNAGRPNG